MIVNKIIKIMVNVDAIKLVDGFVHKLRSPFG